MTNKLRYADNVQLSEIDSCLGKFIDPCAVESQKLIAPPPPPLVKEQDNDQSVHGLINRIFSDSEEVFYPNRDDQEDLLRSIPYNPSDVKTITSLNTTGIQLNTELSMRLSKMCEMVEEIEESISEKRRTESLIQNSNEMFQKLLCSLLVQKEQNDQTTNKDLRISRRLSEVNNGTYQDDLLEVRNDIYNLRKAILEVDRRLLRAGFQNLPGSFI